MEEPRSSLKLVLVISFALKLTSSLLINLFNRVNCGILDMTRRLVGRVAWFLKEFDGG